MTINISGFGSILNIVASTTFPVGFTITQFSNDADAFDFPLLEIADGVMGVNGDLLVWNKANPIKTSVNVVPEGEDDENLSILFAANRVGQGKASARDIITFSLILPNGNLVTFSDGFIISGMPATAVSGEGRMKTKQYEFMFQNVE